MKSGFHFIYIFVIAALTSCNKYLDIVPKGQLVIESTEDFYKMVSLPNRGYPVGNFQYLVDDQWMKESNVIGALKNIDIINFTADTTENRVNRMTASSLYNQAYKYINRWNMVITLVDDSKGDEDMKKLAKAEARVLRAFDHFVILNTFGRPYVPETAATDGGICIMDKYDLEAVPVKSTVAETYAFIEKDLDESIPFLQATPVDVYHPSLAFAWALKAKVHLFKREWDKCVAAAQQSMSYNNKVFDLVAYKAVGGFASGAITAGKNPEVLSYMYMNGRNELNFGYSYIISPELKELFGPTDARFTMFFNTTNRSFLDIGSNTAYWNVKFTDFFNITVGMKTTEVLLMMAECYARQNNLAAAMDLINDLRAKRIVDPLEAHLETPATIKETVDIVIKERRKELLFGFHRFWDLRRLNTEPDYAKTVVHKFPLVNTSVPQVEYKLPPNSYMYIIPFAQDVLKKNPSLTLNTNEVIPW
ncbi:RagB/SusD family nutrient uptake outer membrane protein [Chitinophaga rhizophila]|uniref:RagB/SusD family nutrient uptake outer membrane protein n=1 Tax=Chitinophaga rhizophila TaxID=2866212 RepID=A0ABS7GC02_9BACT|nr:RagB/SusD family nutrient uptake outer membrane protein [Chitinophaga rhizophila]MBW8684795.1 RagB/SusD family nutrient uptake outer membrane protein [Chitinophaga rhizophila]